MPHSDEQRANDLEKQIEAGGKKLSGVLRSSKRAVKGVVAEFSSDKLLASQAERNRMFAALSEEYNALNSNINDWVESEVEVTAKNWYNYAREDLPKSAKIPTFGAFSDKYIFDIISQISPSTVSGAVAINAQLGGMLANDIRRAQAAFSTTLAEASIEGLTRKEMVARMVKKVGADVGQFQFIDKAGRRWQAENYFGMLNRSLHAQAARETYKAAAVNEAGYDLYQVTGGVTGSSVTTPGDPCDQWAGRIFSMTGATEGYPTYDDVVAAGVYHVNCVHQFSLVLPSEMFDAREYRREMRKKEKDLPDE